MEEGKFEKRTKPQERAKLWGGRWWMEQHLGLSFIQIKSQITRISSNLTIFKFSFFLLLLHYIYTHTHTLSFSDSDSDSDCLLLSFSFSFFIVFSPQILLSLPCLSVSSSRSGLFSALVVSSLWLLSLLFAGGDSFCDYWLTFLPWVSVMERRSPPSGMLTDQSPM